MAELDNYLPCEQYAAASESSKYPGFKAWFDEATGAWYFAAVTNKGRVVLRSEAYTTEAARDNGIESVMRNRDIEERYSVAEDDGKWYIILKAGNRQEIARSCAHGSEAAATADIAMCASDAVETAAIVEDYLSCASYEGHAASERYAGFTTFTNAENGQHYFALVDGAGNVMLRSEGYTTEASRNNGIESVTKNRDNEERYSVAQDENDGQWYIILKAGNHQEIARSCGFESEEGARAILARSFAPPASAAIVEDYLSCEAYSGQAASEKYPEFTTFTNVENGQHYFALVDGAGNVMMRSEGYTTEASRNNGIESVIKNRDNEERYSVAQDENDGQWYIILKAGNHQEIARSCGFESEEGARAILARSFAPPAPAAIVEDYLPCESYVGQAASEKYPGFTTFTSAEDGQHYFAMVDSKGAVVLRSEAYKSEAARNNGIESVQRNREIEERYSVAQDETDGEWYISLKAGNHQEIARSCGHSDEAGARAGLAALFAPPAVAAIVEDYLPCASYTGQTKSEKYPGFTTFTSPEDGQHYFAMVDGHDGVILRSEAYTTEASRNNGIESVLKNRDIEERYSITQDESDGQWYVALKAGNHQEIARSCGFADKAAADGHLLHCYSRAALEKIATGEGEITEDYLPCAAYEGHPASTFEGFTIFQDPKTKLHYFAMLDDDGKVALKSEGYKDPTRRDNGIESVLRNRGIKDHWREMEDEHGPYMSLRAVNHQEIARSCHKKDKAAMLAWFLPLVAGHAAWGKDAEPEEVVAIAPPAPTKVVVNTEKPVVAPPPVTSYTAAPAAAAATDAGGGWWKWLLGALLLGLLAWLLMRGCEKTPTPPVVAPVTATPPPTTTPAPAPAPTPAPAATCNCDAQTDPVFRLGTGTPKSLHRLGTNPEFGDSHGLSGAEFYSKLQDRSGANPIDKKFLDRMFKAMGYKNGFADAKPEMFSEVEIPAGTVGNIGYSKAHKTLYAKLDTQGKDLLAFRIKSANGCDLHFMKTCGNHFFTCNK
jgi:uncharacterized protein YegP (UPF0339 family)